MRRGSIATGGVGLLLGAAVTLGIHAVDDEQIYALARTDLAAAEANENEAAHTVLQVEGRVGQACVRAADVLVSGGQLTGAPEEGAVTDLVAEPGAHCGETRTAAHTALSALHQAARKASATDEAMVSARAAFTEAEEQRGFNFGEVASAAVSGLLFGGIGNIPRLWFGPDVDEALDRRNNRRTQEKRRNARNQSL